jgi:hypothetical protein
MVGTENKVKMSFEYLYSGNFIHRLFAKGCMIIIVLGTMINVSGNSTSDDPKPALHQFDGIKMSGLTGQQTETATVYFFRPKKISSSAAEIIVGTEVPDEVIVKLKNGRWCKVDYDHVGKRDFVAGVYVINPEKFQYDIEPGKTYYVRWTVLSKGFKVMAELEMMDDASAREEMEGLKEQTKLQ